MSHGRISASRFWDPRFAAWEGTHLWPRCPRIELPGVDDSALRWVETPADWFTPLGDPPITITGRRRLRSLRAVLPCNWKVAVDAHNEALHVPWLHPEIAHAVDWAGAKVELLGRHSRISVKASGGLTEQLFLFPNVHVNISGDAAEVQILRHRPLTATTCSLDFQVYGPAGVNGPDAPHKAVPLTDPGFGPVTGADLQSLGSIQRGLQAQRFPGVSLGLAEVAVAHAHAQIDRLLSLPT